MPPHEYKSFRFIASSEYEAISFQNTIHSEVDNTSMFNWFLLNTSAYQNYRYHRSYTSIINDTELRNEMDGFSCYYKRDLPAGEYVFVLEHISGTKNLIIELAIGLASSPKEMNALFSSITRTPIYRNSLPSFFLIAINTGGLLGILALKKVNKRKSNNLDLG
ncbi:MAG: hypothetical protein ACFFC7_14050 [Candidatus Hermodarchaeota archaeon]